MDNVQTFIFSVGLIFTSQFGSAQPPQAKPSQAFRQEHVEIKTHLDHVTEWAGGLGQKTPADQKETMKKIVEFFKGHIIPHAEWEEKFLYPAVDKRAGGGKEPFTSTMRYEHKIVGRWTSELDKESQKKNVDPILFMRKTDRLVGLISAHFEEEEEVLLPILDRTMSKAEFEKEIPSHQ